MSQFAALAEHALDLARQRHQAISASDFERYEALSGPLEQACSKLAAMPDEVGAPGVFHELAALEVASARLLDAEAAGVSGRLGELASHARTNRAYLRSGQFSVNRR